jgi:hypothetical protein
MVMVAVVMMVACQLIEEKSREEKEDGFRARERRKQAGAQ